MAFVAKHAVLCGLAEAGPRLRRGAFGGQQTGDVLSLAPFVEFVVPDQRVRLDKSVVDLAQKLFVGKRPALGAVAAVVPHETIGGYARRRLK
jgi:hypothetical protein